jgi:hypothetical protein
VSTDDDGAGAVFSTDDDDGAKVDVPTGDDTSEGIPPELDG